MVFSPDPLYNKIIKEIVLWGTKVNVKSCASP